LGFVDIASHLGEQAFSSQTREIEKHAYYQNYCIDSNQILHSDKDHQMPFVGGPNTHITNPKWRTAAILEKSKIAISPPRFDRFRLNLARRRSSAFLSRPTVKSFKNLKIQDGGGRHLEKSKYRHTSAMVGAIASKFGTLTQFDPLDHSVSKNGTSSCIF